MISRPRTWWLAVDRFRSVTMRDTVSTPIIVHAAARRVGLKPAPDVHASPGSAHPLEGSSVRSHEILHGHRRLTGHFADDLVFAREDAVLIVEGDRAEMLDQVLRQACLLETLPILRNGSG